MKQAIRYLHMSTAPSVSLQCKYAMVINSNIKKNLPKKQQDFLGVNPSQSNC